MTDVSLALTRYSATLLYIVGIYTSVNLYLWEGFLVPTVLSGLAGTVLLAINYRRIGIDHAVAIAALLSFALCSVIVKGTDAFYIERIKGMVQLGYSVFFAYVFFLELSFWEKQKLRRLFYFVSVSLIIGCALENFTEFKHISDNFRHAFFRNSLYEAPERDIEFFGRDRPKLFTTEPSMVGVFILFSISTWWSLSKPGIKVLLHASFLCLAAIYFTGSPFLILFFLPIVPVVQLFLFEGGPYKLLRKAGRKKLLSYSALLILLLAMMAIAATTVLAPRLESALSGGGSTIIRLVAPPFITLDFLREHPFWGAGVGAKEMFASFTFDRLYFTFNVFYVGCYKDVSNFVTNAFWLHWLYFGLLGGFLMILASIHLMRVLGVRHYLYCLIMIAIYGQTMGGYVGLKFWSFFFCVMLTSRLFSQDMTLQTNVSRRV